MDRFGILKSTGLEPILGADPQTSVIGTESVSESDHSASRAGARRIQIGVPEGAKGRTSYRRLSLGKELQLSFTFALKVFRLHISAPIDDSTSLPTSTSISTSTSIAASYFSFASSCFVRFWVSDIDRKFFEVVLRSVLCDILRFCCVLCCVAPCCGVLRVVCCAIFSVGLDWVGSGGSELGATDWVGLGAVVLWYVAL